jgi:hypothetical protein
MTAAAGDEEKADDVDDDVDSPLTNNKQGGTDATSVNVNGTGTPLEDMTLPNTGTASMPDDIGMLAIVMTSADVCGISMFDIELT